MLPPEIVAGAITLWYSSVGSIPPGWALCDGNNGTPDLRDKFTIGAGVGFAVGAEGGSATHTHDGTTDGHSHNLAGLDSLDGTDLIEGTGDIKTDTFTTVNGSVIPLYKAIVYIMAL